MTNLDPVLALLIVILFLLATLGLGFYLTVRLFQDMLDRLMSKDFNEYKAAVTAEENDYSSQDTALTDLEEAREEIVNG